MSPPFRRCATGYKEMANLVLSSNPRSPNYGKHMTAEEVIDFFAPEQYRVDQIMEWLSEAGISTDRLSLSTNKQVRQPVLSRVRS